MSKILIISMAIIAYPILRLRYRKIFMDIKIWSLNKFYKLSDFAQRLAPIKHKIWGINSSKLNIFEQRFTQHFHPNKGEFQDKELRGRVYHFLIDSVRKGSNYKALYRKTTTALHPDSAVNSRLMRAELEVLFKYFQNNFTHPDKL